MAKMKYVRHSIVGFVTWPDMNNMFHAHLGKFLLQAYGGEIISAGFVELDPDTSALCFGKSDSLGIGSLPEDSDLYTKQLAGEA